MGAFLDLANRVIHPLLLRYLDKQYRKKNRKVRQLHPELYVNCSKSEVEAHCNLWRGCSSHAHVDPSWFIMHSNISGVHDIRYVPENIYFAYIEPVLNEMDMAPYVADKNLLESFVPVGNVPKAIIRYMRGSFFDPDFKLIDENEAQRRVDKFTQIVVKKSVDSSGGEGVCFIDRSRESFDVKKLYSYGRTPFIVQSAIKQHEQSSKFNSGSVNTCRVMTLRCPWNGEVVLLKSMLRVGCGASFCDNMMKGGLCLGVYDDGRLNRYAYDYNGKRYTSHPISNICFQDSSLPLYPKMVEFALKVAGSIPYMNILSFDLVANNDGEVVCLELNTAGQGITQLQYDGIPLFRDYTNDVIHWCAKHQNLNMQRHLKTFYW